MKSGLMNRWTALLIFVCMFIAGRGSGAAPAVETVPLPSLARIQCTNTGEDSWRQSGVISGSAVLAEREFRATLAHGGWVLNKSIELGRGIHSSGLSTWSRNGDKLLLMIWEIRAGMCGFSWGYSL